MFFFDFSKNSTIEKTDIYALKNFTNQKNVNIGCKNSANLAFFVEMHLQISSNFFMFFVENHHLKQNSRPPLPLALKLSLFSFFFAF